MDFASITQWLSDAYRDNVPSNARAYLKGVSGDTSPIDQSFFSAAELDALRRAAARGWAEWSRQGAPVEGVPDDVAARVRELSSVSPFNITMDQYRANRDELTRLALEHKISDENMRVLEGVARTRPSIQYSHYDDPDASLGTGGLWSLLTDPSNVMQTTVGRAVLERTPDGSTVVNDRYQFHRGQAAQNSSVFSKLDRLGERLIPEGKGFDMRIDLGPSENWFAQPPAK